MTHDSATSAARTGEASSEAANAAKHGQMHTLRFPVLTQEFPETIRPLSNQSQLFRKAVTPPCETSAGGTLHNSRGADIRDTPGAKTLPFRETVSSTDEVQREAPRGNLTASQGATRSRAADLTSGSKTGSNSPANRPGIPLQARKRSRNFICRISNR